MSFGPPPAIEFIEGRSTAERPFVPIVGTLAAEINQVPAEAFLSDPTQLANGLQRAQRLFDLDALCVVPDPSFVAEAFGASVEWSDEENRFVTTEYASDLDSLTDPTKVPNEGRVPTIVEAADRLLASTDGVAILGMLPGPETTAAALFEDSTAVDEWAGLIRTATGEVARALGRAGVHGFLLAETPTVHDGDRETAAVETVVEVLDVLANQGELFGTSLAFAPGGNPEAAIASVADEASLDALFLDVEGPADTPDLPEVRLGLGITESVLAGDDDEIERTVRERVAELPSNAFLASGVEVPREVHPRKLQAIQQADETASHHQ